MTLSVAFDQRAVPDWWPLIGTKRPFGEKTMPGNDVAAARATVTHYSSASVQSGGLLSHKHMMRQCSLIFLTIYLILGSVETLAIIWAI